DLEKVFVRAGELEITLSHVFKPAFASKITALFVGRRDFEVPGGPVDGGNRLRFLFFVGGSSGALLERSAPRPAAGFIRRKMRAPFIARLGGSLRGVAIGGEIPGHAISWSARFVTELDRETAVTEWVGRVVGSVTLGDCE